MNTKDLATPDPAREALRHSARWLFAERALLVIWVLAVVVTMFPRFGKASGLYGGFFTSYAADLANPPWLYIVFRRGQASRIAWWLGRSPERAGFSIFAAGAATELSQIYWPHGFFGGTFDPLDIAAYALGLIVCYLADRRPFRR